MAVEFDIKGTRTSEYGWFPEEIEIDPEMNGRHELPNISALIESILTHGQLQPVTIRKTGGKPVLVAGFSRWRAVTEINATRNPPKPIRLRCSYTQLTEMQAFLANIAENHVRNQTTPMDDAYNIQKLLNVYRLSEDEAAKAYGMSKQWVKDRLSLLQLTSEAETAVRSGRVAPTAAKAIAKVSKDQQKRILAQPGKITAADVKRETAPEPKPTLMPVSKPSLRAAALAILGDCDQQPDVMVYEIHRDLINALRAALEA